MKLLEKFWLELTQPYPFQLWIAPRKKKWCFARPEAEPKRKSPPGFGGKQTEYAMYLYPDSIYTYWLIYFFISVPLHIVLNCFLVNEILSCCNILKYIFGYIAFVAAYYAIYVWGRRPVLEELWYSWPNTKQQDEYFKNIPSKITFYPRCDFYKYESQEERACRFNLNLKNKENACEKYGAIIDFIFDIPVKIFFLLKSFLLSINLESLFFCRFVFLKSTYFFKRPIFFNPSGSIQEGMLRAATADLFAVEKKKFIKSIVFYYLSHIWISFIYLSANLLFAFRWHPYKNQNETIPLAILIVIWAIVSMPILFKQYISIKLFYDYDEKLFRFSPKRVSFLAKQKMHLNRNLVDWLNPKKTFIILYTLAFGSYLLILNLVMQYANPNENTKPSVELNVKNECRHMQIKIVESPPCEEECCF